MQKIYPIMEQFYSLQGEGCFTGYPANFIRLGGCDVGCHWCDVKESWEADAHPQVELEKIIAETVENDAPIVIVTGGEPSMYDLSDLTGELKKAGKRTHIETAGTNLLTGDWDWVCLSPKKFKPVVEENFLKVDELKVVVFNRSDFKFAEENAAKVSQDCKLYLQVEWGKRDKLSDEIVEYIKANPKWKLSIQTHKGLGIR